MFKHKYSLYDILKDEISGLTGVVLGISKELTGEILYGLQPQGVLPETKQKAEWSWCQQSRLVPILDEKNKPTRVNLTVPEFEEPKFKFYDEVHDTITLYFGKVTEIIYYASGCITYVVVSPLMESISGQEVSRQIPEQRLKLVVQAKKEKQPKNIAEGLPSPPAHLVSRQSRGG